MKEFPGTHSPARGGRSSSTTPDFAGKERGERRGVMFSEEFLSPLRGSGETGNPSFPGQKGAGTAGGFFSPRISVPPSGPPKKRKPLLFRGLTPPGKCLPPCGLGAKDVCNPMG